MKVTRLHTKNSFVLFSPNTLEQGVQPFAIAGRITLIYMKYGRQGVRVIFMRYIYSIGFIG